MFSALALLGVPSTASRNLTATWNEFLQTSATVAAELRTNQSGVAAAPPSCGSGSLCVRALSSDFDLLPNQKVPKVMTGSYVFISRTACSARRQIRPTNLWRTNASRSGCWEPATSSIVRARALWRLRRRRQLDVGAHLEGAVAVLLRGGSQELARRWAESGGGAPKIEAREARVCGL